MKAFLKRIDLAPRTWIVMLLISICIGIVVPVMIDNNDDKSKQTCELTIEVLDDINEDAIPNHEVWINSATLSGENSLSVLFSNCRSNGFEYRSAGEYGYSNDVITNIGGAGSTITFAWEATEGDHIEFWKQNYSGIVKLTLAHNGRVINETKVDLFSNETGAFYDYSLDDLLEKAQTKYTSIKIYASIFLAIAFALVSTIVIGYGKQCILQDLSCCRCSSMWSGGISSRHTLCCT